MEMPDVLILAGGRGTRLPGGLPKPLRPVNGRPFMAYIIDQVRFAGARRIVLALGHKAEAFRDFAQRESLETSVESTPLGTGGALKAALPLLSGNPILVLNGDSYADADLESLASSHRRRHARATMLLAKVDDASRYGRVEIDAGKTVIAFSEKTATGPGLINAGIYVLERAVVEEIPSDRPVSLERETFPSMIGRGFFGEPGEFAFTDIGTPESYAASSTFFHKTRVR